MMLPIKNLPPAARNSSVWTIVLLISTLAWIYTIQQSLHMPVSLPGTMGLQAGQFLAFWLLMVLAMMLPTIAPPISTFYEMRHEQAHGTLLYLRTGIFMFGYLLLWTLLGLPTFFFALLGQHLALSTPFSAITVGAASIVIAGCYQFTPIKTYCLAHCAFATTHTCFPQQTSANTWLQDGQAGVKHGLYCLGCCGALMFILVPLGLMSLFWMIALTIIIFLEKALPPQVPLRIFIGIALLCLGLFAWIYPTLMPGFYLPPN